MARINLFSGRELWINEQALRHPIDALRNRLDQPAFELRRRTNPAPAAPRVPFAPLEINTNTGLTLSQSIRTREIAEAAAEAGRRAAALRALTSLPKHEDLPKATPVSVSKAQPKPISTDTIDRSIAPSHEP